MSAPITRAEVDALNAAFMTHGNAGDAAALVKGYYAEDALLMPPGTAKNLQGQKAILSFWKKFLGKEQATKIWVGTVSLDVQGDMAAEVGKLSYVSPDAKGVKKKTTGKYVVVYRRQPSGEVRAHIDIFSTNT